MPAAAMPFSTVLALATNERQFLKVLAGTYGGGVYASEDGGQTWISAGLSGRKVVGLAMRADGAVLIAAVAGPWAAIYRTQDGGRTWEAANSQLPQGTYPTVACAVGNSFLVGARSEGGGTVLYTSDDGLEWRSAGQGLPDDLSEVSSLACNNTDAWAVTDGGVYHGRPGGEWVLDAPLPESQMGSITFSGGKVYMATSKGIYLRIPGGWQKESAVEEQGLLSSGSTASSGFKVFLALRSGRILGEVEAPPVAVQPTPARPKLKGLPTDPVQPPAEPSGEVAYFPETGHTIARGFLAFWKANGGLEIFGYPLTEEFEENGRTVQYFERARLEYYPEYSSTPNVIQLGQLGREFTRGRYFLNIDFFASKPDRYFFKETEHSLAGAFLRFWNDKGGVRIFGYPISEEMREEGRTVQYFERARFEYHPETPEREVEVTDLGRRLLVQRGWLSD